MTSTTAGALRMRASRGEAARAGRATPGAMRLRALRAKATQVGVCHYCFTDPAAAQRTCCVACLEYRRDKARARRAGEVK
jgi:hypothetical protein